MACRSRPSWEFYQGIRLVEDVGNGMGLRLSWGRAIPADSDKAVYYNIYYANTRFDVFDNWPRAITDEQQVVVNVTPGKIYYFAVRAIEYDAADFDITQLTQIGTSLYKYPGTLELQNDIDAYGATIQVSSTNDYPESGFLLIDTEILQYSIKDGENFYIEDTQRGAVSTYIDTHEAGAEIKLWRGVEDRNSVIYEGTAAWHKTYGTPRNVDEIGEFNVMDDGYRGVAEDILTTDLSASDQNTEDFPEYDYTGYRRSSPTSLFSGSCEHSYVGGEFNGGRGFFFQDRSLARLDTMLQLTGQQAILLKRKWTGRRCRCAGLRREHPQARCKWCYGTYFDGGYDRYINPRPISELYTNTQGFIQVRIEPYTDDLELTGSQALRQNVEFSAWTLNIPQIRDRDILIFFDEEGVEEYRYSVQDVTRNKLFFGQSGKQPFKIKRLDKTDQAYTYRIEEL